MASSIQINAGADYVRFSGSPARFVLLLNSTGVSLDYRIGETEYAIASGSERMVEVTSSTSEIEVRRTDLEAATVPASILFAFQDSGDVERMHGYALAFDNSGVSLAATTVQEAIVEILARMA